MRFGFACAVVGIDVRAHDTRRWQNGPHLCVSLDNVETIMRYAAGLGLRMYRLSSNIAPYYTDPSRPQFGRQLEEARARLAEIGALAGKLDMRLSMHPGQYTVLNSPNDTTYASAVRELRYATEVLDLMGRPPDNKVVLHIGGAYGDKQPALDRFIERYALLPENVRARLVVENDDTIFNVGDALLVSKRTGAPVVFDNLHHRINPTILPNDKLLDEREALAACLATWPAGQVPKIHYSDERGLDEPPRGKAKNARPRRAPRGAHADYVDPEAFAAFLDRAAGLEFDVMFEAKAKELAAARVMAYLRERAA
jgi:UV DNA damage endonuclease